MTPDRLIMLYETEVQARAMASNKTETARYFLFGTGYVVAYNPLTQKMGYGSFNPRYGYYEEAARLTAIQATDAWDRV